MIILVHDMHQIMIMSNFSDFAEGAACGMLIGGIIATSRYGKDFGILRNVY